jgi:quercetin dioxygenase-like cupin family protein
MEETNNNIKQIPQQDAPIDSPLITIDLPALLKKIKGSSWKDSKRNAITVFKTNSLRIVLIALHEGAEMARHIADGIISVQVLEGEIKFNTDLQSVQLSKGQMLTLHERIPHSVLALKETIFLLTLAVTTISE